jgi:hypothetical protein
MLTGEQRDLFGPWLATVPIDAGGTQFSGCPHLARCGLGLNELLVCGYSQRLHQVRGMF